MGKINGNYESEDRGKVDLLLGDNEFESGVLTLANGGAVKEGALLKREADGKFGVISAISTTTYEEVTAPTGSSPKFEGWYEKDGTTYTLSDDTSVQVGVTYYKQVITVQDPVAVYVGADISNASGSTATYEIRPVISGRVAASRCHYSTNTPLSAADKDALRGHSIIAMDAYESGR